MQLLFGNLKNILNPYNWWKNKILLARGHGGILSTKRLLFPLMVMILMKFVILHVVVYTCITHQLYVLFFCKYLVIRSKLLSIFCLVINQTVFVFSSCQS